MVIAHCNEHFVRRQRLAAHLRCLRRRYLTAELTPANNKLVLILTRHTLARAGVANRLLDRHEVVTIDGDVVHSDRPLRDHCERQSISEVLEASQSLYIAGTQSPILREGHDRL